MRVGTFEPINHADVVTIAVAKDDPAYLPQLQKVLEDMEQANQRVEKEAPKMYLDAAVQKGSAARLDNEGLPKCVELKNTILDQTQLELLKTHVRQYASYFLNDEESPNPVSAPGHEFKIDLQPGARPVRLRNRRIADPNIRAEAGRMTDDMLQKVIAQEASGSAWCANVIAGSWNAVRRESLKQSH